MALNREERTFGPWLRYADQMPAESGCEGEVRDAQFCVSNWSSNVSEPPLRPTLAKPIRS